MKLRHKLFSLILWGAVAGLSFLGGIELNEGSSGALVSFFAISLGFNMACIGFIFGSGYSKKLYYKVSNDGVRLIYIVRRYFYVNGWAAIISVSLIIYAPLLEKFILFLAGIFSYEMNARVLWSAVIYATSAVSIYLMLVLLKFSLTSMVRSARE